MTILLTGAYRLFFPAAALFAAIAVPLWLALQAGAELGPADSYFWHQHEMLFGYLPAALAGFLLTAIPNWTGRPAVRGVALLGLYLLWLAGRVAMFVNPDEMLAGMVAVAFLPMLALVATREVWLGGNRRNLPVCAMILLLALADGWAVFVNTADGVRGGFAIAVLMIALIGGRVTPAFMRNWMKARELAPLPAEFGGIDKVALGLTVAAMLLWVAVPYLMLTQVVLALAACALLLRLSRWWARAALAEPLLLALHLGYLWVPLGLGLLAFPDLQNAAYHALGAGAVGGMTLIVMTRALLGHSGRPIIGGALDWLMVAFVHLGAAFRVLAGLMGADDGLIHAAGTFWALGFVLFLLKYLPVALTPRQAA